MPKFFTFDNGRQGVYVVLSHKLFLCFKRLETNRRLHGNVYFVSQHFQPFTNHTNNPPQNTPSKVHPNVLFHVHNCFLTKRIKENY
jgi:hypothetical protein